LGAVSGGHSAAQLPLQTLLPLPSSVKMYNVLPALVVRIVPYGEAFRVLTRTLPDAADAAAAASMLLLLT
jgi:hypothetical protein